MWIVAPRIRLEMNSDNALSPPDYDRSRTVDIPASRRFAARVSRRTYARLRVWYDENRKLTNFT